MEPRFSLRWLSLTALTITLILGVTGCPNPPPLEIPNTTPTAVAGANVVGFAGVPIAFDASGSTDDDVGDTLSFSWDFGDGSPAGVDALSTHTYASAGIYTVTLTVTDGRQASSTDEVYAMVQLVMDSTPRAAVVGARLTTVVAGEPVEFVGSGVDADNDSLSYSWSFGDGTPSVAAATATHVFANGGLYYPRFSVADSGGNLDTDTIAVWVNERPVAVITSPTAGFESVTNTAITFDGSHSSDDGGVASYAWTFGDSGTGSTATVTHTYTTPGDRTVTLVVTDDKGVTASATRNIAIANAPPTVDAGEPIYLDTTSTEAVFNGVTVADSDGSVDDLTYAWSFGDGGTSTSDAPSHTYAASLGVHHVTLTVTDAFGGTATDTTEAIVADLSTPDTDPPVPGFTPPPEDPDASESQGSLASMSSRLMAIVQFPTQVVAVKGRTIGFDATTSYDPGGLQTALGAGHILTFAWDFGDGVTVPAGPSSKEVHAYAAANPYTLTITVTDDDGAGASSETDLQIPVLIVEPPNRAPAPNAGPNQDVWIEPGQTSVNVTFSGTATDPDSGDTITSYAWTFGDGGTGSGATVSHAYTQPGAYTATLTARDNGGTGATHVAKTGTDSALVVVRKRPVNHPPVANAGPDMEAIVGEPLRFSGARSLDADAGDAIVSYRWTLGNGQMRTGPNPDFTYAYTAKGDYPVVLTVTDKQGATATDSAVVTVVDPVTSMVIEIGYVGDLTDPLPFDADHPIRLLIYDRTSETWLADGPVASRTVHNTGRYLFMPADFEGGFKSEDSDYCLLVIHDVGLGNGNYWALFRSGSSGNMSFDRNLYTPVEVSANPVPYLVTFRDTNTATIEVDVW